MPQRPIWRGHLRLALVSCPIALYSANHDRGSLHFNLINPNTGNRIKMITQDAETGDTLSRGDLVKGYEFKKDHYLIVDDEDFESARIESSTTVKIEKFVDTNSIDPIYFDASYYVAPDGDAGQDVYLVLRDAIASTGKIASVTRGHCPPRTSDCHHAHGQRFGRAYAARGTRPQRLWGNLRSPAFYQARPRHDPAGNAAHRSTDWQV